MKISRRALLIVSAVITASLLALTSAVPAFAALELYTDTVTPVFETLPDEYASATHVVFGDTWVEGATNARHGTVTGELHDFDYTYLKADGLGDYSVSFTVPEKGLYKFGFTVMAWCKSVPRSTNVKIDDSKWVYFSYDFNDEDQYKNQYWLGISAVLDAGSHSVTLSLADDFDDSTVKSLYFDDFFYVEAPMPAETTAAAAPAETAASAAETAAPAAAETSAAAVAPQTSDMVSYAAAAAVAAMSAVYFTRRSKHNKAK